MKYIRDKWTGQYHYNTHWMAECGGERSHVGKAPPKCYNTKAMAEFCQKAERNLFKTVRIRLKLLEQIMEDER